MAAPPACPECGSGCVSNQSPSRWSADQFPMEQLGGPGKALLQTTVSPLTALLLYPPPCRTSCIALHLLSPRFSSQSQQPGYVTLYSARLWSCVSALMSSGVFLPLCSLTVKWAAHCRQNYKHFYRRELCKGYNVMGGKLLRSSPY